MADRIEAPFTREQVQALNRWQIGPNHEFTCPNRGDGDHFGSGALRAETDGWICGVCGYTQTWAHAFMAQPLGAIGKGGVL